MSKFRTTLMTALAVATTIYAGGVSISQAGFNPPIPPAAPAVSALSTISGFPLWYQDKTGFALQMCLDQTIPNRCVLPPEFDPVLTSPVSLLTITTTPGAVLNSTNFPLEGFYWIADVVQDVVIAGGGTAKFKLRMAMEGSFVTPVVTPGQQAAFIRINMQKITGTLLPNSTYTVSTPYGNFSFTSDGAGTSGGVGGVFAGQSFRNQLGGLAPLDFASLLPGVLLAIPPQQVADITMDNYLVCSPGTPGIVSGFIGDPAVPCTAVKAGDVTNTLQTVTFAGPGVSGGSVTFSNFFIAGKKIGLDVASTPANNSVTTLVGTPADIQVTVSNITGSTVSFSGGPVVSGVNAADFTIVEAANPCTGTTLVVPPATPPAVSSCTFKVRFNPTATAVAQRNAVITLTPTVIAVAPPAVIPVTGIAQYAITPSTTTSVTPGGTRVAGTIAPATVQNVNAGGTVEFTLAPESGYASRVLVDGAHVATTAPNKYAFSAISNHHTINVKYVRNGDVVENGVIDTSDALRALQVALGIGNAATVDEVVAADVGPLSSGNPNADGIIDVSDVLVILRRAVGLDPAW